MKRIIALAAVGILTVSGCSNTVEPTDVPSPDVNQTTVIPEPTKAPKTKPAPEVSTPDEQKEPNTTKPETSANSSEAGTPATQFAARWGKRYPNVPEFMILKAANGTCNLIDKAPQDWVNNEETIAIIENSMTLAGIEKSDGVEFAQDAQQNYCSSMSNPT